MFDVILHNTAFQLNILFTALLCVALYIFNRQYVFWEALAQFSITAVIILLFNTIFFSVQYDFDDSEILTTRVESATYYEKWDERVSCRHPIYKTRRYKSGKTWHTATYIAGYRHLYDVDHHEPYYELQGKDKSSRYISRAQFVNYAKDFNKTFVKINRYDRLSVGDGNKYVSTPNQIISLSYEHEYTNLLLAASASIMRRNFKIDSLTYKNYLVDYPKLVENPVYGNIYLSRVVDFANSPQSLKDKLLKDINTIAAQTGSVKQINPILILADASKVSPELITVLDVHWKHAKKNDSILLLGIKDSIISWSRTLSWTENAAYLNTLEKKFAGKNIYTYDISTLWLEAILKHFVRKPMEDYNYLKSEIELEWYWQLLIILTGLAANGFLIYIFSTNSEKRHEHKTS